MTTENVEKLRACNPLVDLMSKDFWTVIKNDRYLGMNLAEVCGLLDFIKYDLITGNWGYDG